MAWPGNTVNNLFLKSGEKEEQLVEMNPFLPFLVEPWDDVKGLKVMTEGNLLDRHLHLHSYEIISGRWLRYRSKIQAKKFLRFACGMFLGISIIGVLWLQGWR